MLFIGAFYHIRHYKYTICIFFVFGLNLLTHTQKVYILGMKGVCWPRTKCVSNMNRKDRIVDLMQRNGVTQQQLSKAIGVWPSAVARWIKGEVRPSDEHIEAMAKLFGVTPQYIDWGTDQLMDSAGLTEQKYQQLNAKDKRVIDTLFSALSKKEGKNSESDTNGTTD